VKIFFSIFLFLIFGVTTTVFAQERADSTFVAKEKITSYNIDPLSPAKAAFYSAVLPGLGQVYNKKYWKLPLVYGAIGASLYYYSVNNTKYNQYRDVYKRRLEGYTDDKLSYLDNTRLVNAQKFYQRNRDLSALFVVGFYVLNIIDANVDAALIQFNVNDNLALKPDVFTNDVTFKQNVGLTLHYNF
jgi:hypothetical protein